MALTDDLLFLGFTFGLCLSSVVDVKNARFRESPSCRLDDEAFATKPVLITVALSRNRSVDTISRKVYVDLT